MLDGKGLDELCLTTTHALHIGYYTFKFQTWKMGERETWSGQEIHRRLIEPENLGTGFFAKTDESTKKHEWRVPTTPAQM